MRHPIPILLTALVACTLAVPSADAGSIWARGNRRDRDIQADDVARDVGDSITIVIREVSSVETDTSRGMSKSSSSSAKSAGQIDLGDFFGGSQITMPEFDLSAKATNAFDGDADFDSSRTMTDQMTVTVQDVLPNGNLVVLGKRTREFGGDKQVITVSGIVRVSDVAFDNTVQSDRVAEFHIVYKNTGQQKNFINPGWLARFFNFINPW